MCRGVSEEEEVRDTGKATNSVSCAGLKKITSPVQYPKLNL